MEDDLKELPKQFQNLVRIVGMDAAIRLCREYGGEVVYIPKPDRIEAAKQRELIRREWNGRNVRMLARKYGKSVRWIQKVVERTPEPVISGQVSMGELLQASEGGNCETNHAP